MAKRLTYKGASKRMDAAFPRTDTGPALHGTWKPHSIYEGEKARTEARRAAIRVDLVARGYIREAEPIRYVWLQPGWRDEA